MTAKKKTATRQDRKDTPDFEKALAELEQLVERMEEGDLSLDEALKQFERGVELTRTCQKALREAEQKVRVLAEKSGQEELIPFENRED